MAIPEENKQHKEKKGRNWKYILSEALDRYQTA
jgi:hypothetical protein